MAPFKLIFRDPHYTLWLRYWDARYDASEREYAATRSPDLWPSDDPWSGPDTYCGDPWCSYCGRSNDQ